MNIAILEHSVLKKPEKTRNEVSDRKTDTFSCWCGKSYKARNSLWYHKKKCTFNETIPELNTVSDNELMMIVIQQNKELIQKNTELQTDMLEVLKKGLTTNNTINNNNNKTFNIQVFLNETCKDAMTINDFVDSIKIQLSDLDRIGHVGFVSGISDIIVKELKSIDVKKRPLHCSDVKRETLYIRDEGKWEKGEDDKQKITNMINSVSHKNIQMIPQWREAHPNFQDSASPINDRYNRIILGSLDNSKENNDKIMKNIAKEVKI
tara:strand:+ start:74 stop:865 length:792 start_codon:yes stop_codon:yes gene_type:complete